MKKVENIPMISRPRTTAEPVSVRSFKMRNGMIGLATRDSRTMNATKSAIPMPAESSVWAEPQPSLAAVMMA